MPLDLPREELAADLTLNADAGRQDPTRERSPALANKGDQLTPALIERLRAEGVPYVRVREFKFNRWPARWPFLAAVVGLLAEVATLQAHAKVVVHRTPQAGTTPA